MDLFAAFARAFLREEDGSATVPWMYGLLLLLVLAGISFGSLERQWHGTVAALGLDTPVLSILDR